MDKHKSQAMRTLFVLKKKNNEKNCLAAVWEEKTGAEGAERSAGSIARCSNTRRMIVRHWAGRQGNTAIFSWSDSLVKVIMPWSRTLLVELHSHWIGNVSNFTSVGGSLFHYRLRIITLTLAKLPTWCTITLYNTFIIIILYMFRATLCSSSGGRIVLTQHLV